MNAQKGTRSSALTVLVGTCLYRERLGAYGLAAVLIGLCSAIAIAIGTR